MKFGKYLSAVTGILLGIAVTAIVLILKESQPPGSALKITKMQFTPLEQPDVDIHQPIGPSYSVELPHRWPKANKNYHYGHYHTQLNIKNYDTSLLGIYIPLHKSTLFLYINGHLVGYSGSFEPLITRNWRTPKYFTFNKELNNKEVIDLDIVMGSTHINSGYISAIYLDEHKTLHPIYKYHYYMAEYFVGIEAILLLFFSLIFILFYFKEHHNAYLYFSITCLLWSIYNILMLTTYNPSSNPFIIGCTMQMVMYWYGYYITKTNHAILGVRNLKVERILFFIMLTISALIIIKMLGLQDLYKFLIYTNVAVALIVIIYNVYHYITSITKFNTLENFFLFFMITLTSLLILNDNLIQINKGLSNSYSGHHAAFVFMTVYSILIIQRVQKRKLVSLSKKGRVKRYLAIKAEKERIKADLHDGVAGRLVAMLQSIRLRSYNEHLLEADLQVALSELRQIFQNKSNAFENLKATIIHYSQDIIRILHACNIKSQFNINIGDNIYYPKTTLDSILKVIYETTTNIIKHSNSKQAEFSFYTHDNQFIMSICDNGKGHDGYKRDSGCGVTNIRNRVQSLNGSFSISSSNGTKIKVILPLEEKKVS